MNPKPKTSKQHARWLYRAILAIPAGFALVFFSACAQAAPQSSTSSPPTPSVGVSSASAQPAEPKPEPTQTRVRFSAVGDNLIHSSIYEQAARRAGGKGYDFSYVYENVTYFFENFDVNWINQETLVNSELPPATYPCFSTPAELGWAAYDAGWRVFALSNNHTYDMGAKGITATLNYWDSMPEDVVTPGLFTDDSEDSGIKLQQLDDFTIAYLSYTEQTNGLPTPQNAAAHVIYTSEIEMMERQIKQAATLADAVVVGVHWGVEGSHAVTDAQRALAEKFSNWGADVIIGTHPHVIQPVEWLETEQNSTLVAYSLGNFLSAQSDPDNLIGIALSFEFTQTTDTAGNKQPVSIENIVVTPTITHYDAAYTNVRNYMFKDYTDTLAAQHGVRKRGNFSLEYIQKVLENNIDSKFLSLK